MSTLFELQARLIDGDELSPDEERRLRVAIGVQPALTQQILRDEQLDGLLRTFARCENDGEKFVRQTLAILDDAAPDCPGTSIRPPDIPRARNVSPKLKSRRFHGLPVVLSCVAAMLLMGAILLISSFFRADRHWPRDNERNIAQETNEDRQPPITPGPRQPRRIAPLKEKKEKVGSPERIVLARLTTADRCRWRNDPAPRDDLTAGSLRLVSGTATITFMNGAVVTLTGPANLELISPSRGRLHHGRIDANVPSRAVGFTVESPIAVITDLGTKFGVHVEPDGTTTVNVASGSVEYRDRNPDGSTGKPIRLTAGTSHRVQPLEPKSRESTSRRTVPGVQPQLVQNSRTKPAAKRKRIAGINWHLTVSDALKTAARKPDGGKPVFCFRVLGNISGFM